MSLFRELRLTLKQSLAKMAEACGVGRQTWHDWETGRGLPTAGQVEALESAVGVDGLPCSDYVLSGRDARKWLRPSPYDLRPVNPESRLKAEKNWKMVLERLPLSRTTRRWLLRQVSYDSILEVLALHFLATLRARPLLA